jgi:hypothetical protein
MSPNKDSRGGSRPKVRPDDKRGGLRVTTRPDAKRPGRKAQHYRLILPLGLRPIVQTLALIRIDETGEAWSEERLVETLIVEARDRQVGKDGAR